MNRLSFLFLTFLLACDPTTIADDAGGPHNDDAGAPHNDDAGTPHNDDAGIPANNDAGGTHNDAGGTHNDAGGTHNNDAGRPYNDDAGVPANNDAGGTHNNDAGIPANNDAGQRNQDAGRIDPNIFDAGPLSIVAFSLVTYNVAGLPAFLSPSDPVTNMPFIGPLLSDYDLALVQEDFWYHPALNAGVDVPFRSAPELTDPSLLEMGDGLNRFSKMSIAEHTRFDWQVCHGYRECENDCFTHKGFSFSTIEVSPGLFVDVYNLHMDAGTCAEDFVARQDNANQLAAEITFRSAGRAVIIAGDTNLNLNRPIDVGILDGLVAATGTQIACRVGVCQGESIDRILFRSGNDLVLTVESRERPTHFLAPNGDPLSDHRPTVVHFSVHPL